MNVAIVGCGAVAQVHGKSIEALTGHKIIAVADCIKEKAEAMAKEYKAKAYTDFERMLREEDIQVLHICTPHYLHTSMAVTGLRAGVHVFMEKPPIINRHQWEELYEAVQDARTKGGNKLGICFQNRFNPSVTLIKDKLQKGELGKVLSARGIVTWRRDKEYYTESDWRGSLEKEGGGALINQSIHTLDLLQYFIDEKPSSMEATIANHHLKGIIEVEDTMEAYITYPDTRVCFYASNGYGVNAPPLIELECEKARIRLEELDVTVFYPDGRSEKWEVPSKTALGKSYWGAGHMDCIRYFYESVENHKPFAIEIEQIEDTAWLMLNAYETARGSK